MKDYKDLLYKIVSADNEEHKILNKKYGKLLRQIEAAYIIGPNKTSLYALIGVAFQIGYSIKAEELNE